MTISFGIEFEFDSLVKGGGYTSLGSRAVVCKDGFSYQPDGTAGTELRTPVCVDVKDAGRRISSIFADSNADYAPIMKGIGPEHTSLGQHIHIGQPGRMLDSSMKRKIAVHSKRIYPFLVALHANSQSDTIKSYRGVRSHFCFALREHEAISRNHYGEISDSHVGTVEFRKFDANIPQVTLTCATILKVVAQGAINEKISTKPFAGFEYVAEMQKAVNNGIAGLNVTGYLDFIFKKYAGEWKQLMETEGIPDCVWEVLFLATRGKSVGDIGELYVYGSRTKEFEYFSQMSKNANNFFASAPIGLREILENEGLIGVYEPTIIEEAPRRIHVPAIRVPRPTPTFAIGNIEAEIDACIANGRMPPHIRYAYAVRLYRSGQSYSQVYYALRQYVGQGPAEFEDNFVRSNILNRPQEYIRIAINNEPQIWPTLKARLLSIFAPETPAASNNIGSLGALFEDTAARLVTARERDIAEQRAIDSPPQLGSEPETQTGIYRLGEISEFHRQAAAALAAMTPEAMSSSASRFYISIVEGVITGVAEAHVRCECLQGQVRFCFASGEDVRAALLARITTDMHSAGRIVAVVE